MWRFWMETTIGIRIICRWHLSFLENILACVPMRQICMGTRGQHSLSEGTVLLCCSQKIGLRGLLAIHTSSVVLESSLAASLPLWEVGKKYGEDVLYWMRLMRETDLIGLGNKTGSIYVQREGSAMHDRAMGIFPWNICCMGC